MHVCAAAAPHSASCHSYSQHRGSLHAHILLWVDKEDAKRVEREITATRCKYKLATALDGCPYVPDIPEWSADGQPSVAEQLYLLVSNKQVHNCRTGPFGCKSKGGDAQAAAEADAKCRYGFPYQPNTGEIFLCNATNRHVPLATALLACTAAGARWTEHWCGLVLTAAVLPTPQVRVPTLLRARRVCGAVPPGSVAGVGCAHEHPGRDQQRVELLRVEGG